MGYGFTHQRAITSSIHASHEHAEWKKKENLISKAKLEWAKKTLPPQAKTASGDGMFRKNGYRFGLTASTVISDPNDPNFDLEAYLTKVSAES